MRMLLFILLISFATITHSLGQSLETNGAILLGTNITLGNQNTFFNVSLKGFGTLNYGDASIDRSIYFSEF